MRLTAAVHALDGCVAFIVETYIPQILIVVKAGCFPVIVRPVSPSLHRQRAVRPDGRPFISLLHSPESCSCEAVCMNPMSSLPLLVCRPVAQRVGLWKQRCLLSLLVPYCVASNKAAVLETGGEAAASALPTYHNSIGVVRTTAVMCACSRWRHLSPLWPCSELLSYRFPACPFTISSLASRMYPAMFASAQASPCHSDFPLLITFIVQRFLLFCFCDNSV